MDDYAALLQRQEQLGLVTRNDVLRARLAADNAGAAERAAAAERDTALSELTTFTGAELTTDCIDGARRAATSRLPTRQRLKRARCSSMRRQRLTRRAATPTRCAVNGAVTCS